MANDDLQDVHEEVRSRTLQLMLDKVHADTYPSTTMLDIIEDLLGGPDDIADYAEVLWAKIEGDTYPSYGLIRRLIAFT
jgi:hypothetical protein